MIEELDEELIETLKRWKREDRELSIFMGAMLAIPFWRITDFIITGNFNWERLLFLELAVIVLARKRLGKGKFLNDPLFYMFECLIGLWILKSGLSPAVFGWNWMTAGFLLFVHSGLTLLYLLLRELQRRRVIEGNSK